MSKHTLELAGGLPAKSFAVSDQGGRGMNRDQRSRWGRRLLPARRGLAVGALLSATVVALAALPVTPAQSAERDSDNSRRRRRPVGRRRQRTLAVQQARGRPCGRKGDFGRRRHQGRSGGLLRLERARDRPAVAAAGFERSDQRCGWLADRRHGARNGDTCVPANASLAQLIQVARSDGGVVSDVRIEGFVLQAGAQSVGVSLTRVQGYPVSENSFRAPMRLGVQSVALSGTVTGNHFRGIGNGVTLNAGYAESPSSVVVTGNRSVQNSLGGGAGGLGCWHPGRRGSARSCRARQRSQWQYERQPGVRTTTLPMSPDPGLAQSTAGINPVVRDNRIDGNRIGIQVDAGFPVRTASGVCESRVYSGAVEVELAGNTLTNSLQAPALMTLTAQHGGTDPLDAVPLAVTCTVRHSQSQTGRAHLPGTWIDNPASDPVHRVPAPRTP